MTHDLHDTTNKQKPKSEKKKKTYQNSEKNPIDWINNAYDPVNAERSMWVAVITQAMMDALSRSRKPDEQFCKFEATRWLTNNNGHFRNVCMLAGMDPDYVRVKAKKALAENISWRAEAGTGKRYEERKMYRERIKKSTIPTAHPLPPLHTVANLIAIPCENSPI